MHHTCGEFLQSNIRHNRLFQLIAIVFLLVIIDQVSKAVVRAVLLPGGSISVIDDVLRVTYVQNFTGFSFWVPALPAWAKTVFQALLIFIVLAAFPVYIFYTNTRRQSIWADITFAGITASCFGHLIDDFFVKYTTDFIQVFRSPSANFADIYSYIAVCALAVETILMFRIRKLRWKGFRHLIASEIRIRKEFFEFFRRFPHSSK